MSFKGRKNIYVCDRCHGHIVTVDLDEGVTPFSLSCRATDGCKGFMTSSLYRVFDQSIGAGWEWYRPGPNERHSPSVQEHVDMGGLLLRKVAPPGPPIARDHETPA